MSVTRKKAAALGTSVEVATLSKQVQPTGTPQTHISGAVLIQKKAACLFARPRPIKIKPSRRSIFFCGQRTKGKRESGRERQRRPKKRKIERERKRERKKVRGREKRTPTHTDTSKSSSFRHCSVVRSLTLQSSTLKVPSELDVAKKDMREYALHRTRTVNAFAQRCIAAQPSHNNLQRPKSTWPTESTKSETASNKRPGVPCRQ